MTEEITVHEVELPSGVVFRGATFPEVYAKYAEHQRASIAEGRCPRHATPLEPFPATPGLVSGKCDACQTFYALDPDTQDVHANFYAVGQPPWALQ